MVKDWTFYQILIKIFVNLKSSAWKQFFRGLRMENDQNQYGMAACMHLSVATDSVNQKAFPSYSAFSIFNLEQKIVTYARMPVQWQFSYLFHDSWCNLTWIFFLF